MTRNSFIRNIARRALQFRITTLLVAVALIALACVLFLPLEEWREEQRLRELMTVGYEVHPVRGGFRHGIQRFLSWRKATNSLHLIDIGSSANEGIDDNSTTSRADLNLNVFRSMHTLILSNESSEERLAPTISGLTRLERLQVSGFTIDSYFIHHTSSVNPSIRDIFISNSHDNEHGVDLKPLFAARSLESAEIRWTAIEPGSLSHLRHSKLKLLYLVGCRITDSDIGSLAQCEDLEEVSISLQELTDKCIEHFILLDRLPRLKCATLSFPFSDTTPSILARKGLDKSNGKLLVEHEP